MAKGNKGINRKRKAELEKEFDNIFSPKNLEKAGKLGRELSVLSTEDLLKPFTI